MPTSTSGQEHTETGSPVPSINRLPAEILLHIWDFYIDDPTPVFPPSRTGQHRRGSVHVLTSMCSHWRTLAIDTPHLWTRFDATPPLKVDGEELARRSGTLPLSLTINAQAEGQIVVPDAVRDRVRRVDLVVSQGLITPDLLQPLPFAQLEVLTVCATDDQPGYTVVVPLTLDGDMPALRALAIFVRSIAVRTTLQNLTHLFVQDETYDFEELQDYLSRTPRLEVLQLQIRPWRVDYGTPKRITPLPSLRLVKISLTDLHTSMDALALLEIPVTAAVYLHLTDPGSAVATRMPPGRAETITHLEIVGPTLVLRAETMPADDSTQAGGYFCFSADWQARVGKWADALGTLTNLENLHTLHLSLVDNLAWERFLPQLLATSPRIATIVAAYPRHPGAIAKARKAIARDLFKVLLDALEQEEPVLCPALTTFGVRSPSAHILSAVAERLAGVAETRQRLGHPFHAIVVDALLDEPRKTWNRSVARAFDETEEYTVEPWEMGDLPRFSGEGLACASVVHPYWELATEEMEREQWDGAKW